MTSKNKPARSDEDKQKNLDEIIDAGRELFVKKGTYGFSTRALAKKIKMTQGNLYNYVKSKRELWIAIRSEDMKIFKKRLQSIADTHEESYILLFKRMMNFYLDFARNEYRRFQMMFMVPAPPSDEIGPIEKEYELINPLEVVKNALKKAMDAGEIRKTDVDQLSYTIYALIHGATAVERDLLWTDKILEPQPKKSRDPVKAFRDYLFEQMLKILKS
ncbi:MAG: TetR family transcriptional regulator [Candidatus Lokiarchaeota archaeon]|nr:TetR family transcriptional regulator [Candidatus Lokiarchaeota archaeon]MBD3199135.1 TetR family transcriptional regulator [Candidatus Lokiarchaeota archaeon]